LQGRRGPFKIIQIEYLILNMSSRAVRKALKRLEAQKGLQQETTNEISEEEEEEEEMETSGPSNPFAMV
jgi:hypothetical protein